MRKLSLAVSLGVALVAFLGLSAPALAAIDPLCDDGKGGIKPLGLYEQDVKTELPYSYYPDKSRGQGYACSGEDYPIGATDHSSLFDKLDVVQPPNAYVEYTLDDAHNSYVGHACVGALSNVIGYLGRSGGLAEGPCPSGQLLDNSTVRISVDNQRPGRDCPSGDELVACFYGETTQSVALFRSHGWIWVTYRYVGDDVDPSDPPIYDYRYVLTIGRFHPALGLGEAGLTRIEPRDGGDPFNPPFQCAYLGSPGSNTCGSDTDPLLFATGDPVPEEEREFCASPGGYSWTYPYAGTYWLKATRRDAQDTGWVTSCMPWE